MFFAFSGPHVINDRVGRWQEDKSSPGWCHKMEKTQSLPRHPLHMPGLSISSRQHDEDRARLQGCGATCQMQTGECGEGAAWIADGVCKTWQLGLWSTYGARLARLSLQFRQTAGFTGSHLKEGKCCRNCLPEYLTLQLCTQLNTQISE